jgi:hypothetical protein
MAHEWHAGVLSSSSWHGLEEVGILLDADGAIDAGERTGAWPVSLDSEKIFTSSGLECPANAIVASYRSAPRKALGVVGDRYRATTPEAWRSLVRAACLAGAKPTGAFALRDGTRVLATFDVGGNGIRTQLILCDAFDGSMRLTAGTTSVRVVCANTLAAAMRTEGEGMSALRHTVSLESKVKVLEGAIADTIATGEKVRETFARAEKTFLDRDAARAIFDALFPEAPKDASKAAQTKAETLRCEARRAAALPINRVGDERGNLATLWNAATYVVDRHADGTERKVRGGEALDSMLFGQRAARVSQIQTVIELCMRDGTTQAVTASQALDMGADLKQVGAKVLEDILSSN